MVSQDERVMKQIIEAADTPGAKNSLQADIQRVTSRVANTLEDFKIVEAKLIGIDDQNLTDIKFTPQWRDMHIQYKSIIVETKDLASEIAAYSIQFEEAILNIVIDKSIPTDDRKCALEDAIEQTTKYRDLSQKIATDVDELSNKLVAFQENITTFGETREGQFVKEIDEIQSVIDKLRGEIEDIDINIMKVARHVKTKEIGIGIAGGIFPIFGLYLLIAGMKNILDLGAERDELIDLKEQRFHKTDEQARNEDRKAEINQTLPKVAATRTVVTDISRRIDSIRGALQYFDSIWSGVKGECVQILSHLNRGNTLVDKVAICKFYLNCAKTPYSALAESLNMYVSGLSKVAVET